MQLLGLSSSSHPVNMIMTEYSNSRRRICIKRGAEVSEANLFVLPLLGSTRYALSLGLKPLMKGMRNPSVLGSSKLPVMSVS